MRLIMMGTGPFAVPTFRSLLASEHQVAALFTRPPRPVHGKKAIPSGPMRAVAEEHGLAILEPDSINTDEARAQLRALDADLMVVCDYGQILSDETLACARLGGINLHASLLPKYRGAAPINWAIYHGETETGATVIHMTPKLDAGPCLVQKRMPIDPHDTAVEVEAKLAELGVSAVHEAIEMLAAGRADAGIVQDPKLATKAPRLKKTDGQIDWSRSATALWHQVRAMQPWPKSHTFWHRPSGEPLRLILEEVTPVGQQHSAEPGTVLQAAGSELVIAAGGGALKIHRIQPAGKRVLTTDEFLRGYPVGVAEHFGAEQRTE